MAGSLSDETVVSLYVDRRNNVWVGTRDGLNRYEREDATFTHFYHDPRVTGSLSSNIVSCMLEDSHDNFWVGTYDGGICKLDRTTNGFIRYTHNLNPSDGPITNAVISMYEDNAGTVWFGTAGGVSCYDRRADKFIMRTATPDDPNGLVNVRGICESRKGGVWVGLNGGGVAHIDRQDNMVTRFRSRRTILKVSAATRCFQFLNNGMEHSGLEHSGKVLIVCLPARRNLFDMNTIQQTRGQ